MKLTQALLLTTLFALLSACGGGGGDSAATNNTTTNNLDAPVVNSAPTLNTTAFSVRNDQIATGSFNATDADGDTLTGKITQQPAHGALTINTDFTYSYDPVDSYVGVDTVVIEVSDGSDTTTVEVTITVQTAPADAALTVSAIAGDTAIEIGQTKLYTLTIADADGLQTVTVQLKNNLGAVVKDLPSTNVSDLYSISLASAGLSAGSYTISVKATGVDGGVGANSSEQEVTKAIAVSAPPVDAPLSVSAITGDASIEIGKTKAYTFTVTDSDGIKTLVPRLKDSGGNVVTVIGFTQAGSSYTVNVTGFSPVGNYTLAILAEGVDGGIGENSESVEVTKNIQFIEPVDAALSVSSVAGESTVAVGQVKQYRANISDEDGIQSVVAKLKNALNIEVQTLTQSEAGGEYTFTLNSAGLIAGEYSLEVSAIGVDGGTGNNSGLIKKSLVVTLIEPSAIPEKSTFTAWIGENDSEIAFDQPLDGVEFYRSRDKACDIENYASCASGQVNILGGNAVTDTAFNLHNSAYFQLKSKGSVSSTSVVSTVKFSPRYDHQVVDFKGKLWLVGGTEFKFNSFRGTVKNDIWSSVDGINWVEEVESAAFSPRRGHQVVVYKNKMWLIGGYSSEKKNDVWSSSDGITWVEEISNAAFPARSQPEVVVHDNKLWLIAGSFGTFGTSSFRYGNDVWSSVDGVIWVQATSNAAFSGRIDHSVTSYNNKLWVIAGFGDKFGGKTVDHMTDVWSSEDGRTWTRETSLATFPMRSGHQVVVYGDKLWLIGGGGYGNSEKGGVWSSEDGVTWKEEEESWRFYKRRDHQSLVRDNKIWIVGGRVPGSSSIGNSQNDTWSSTDGVKWLEASTAANFPARSGHQVVEYKNKLWMFGGQDIWTSQDGMAWTLVTLNASYSHRYGHQVIVYRDKLWVIGGNDGAYKNDVWSSTDGISWKQETASAAFLGRKGHQVVEFNNKLWLIGGYAADLTPVTGRHKVRNDVWSSVDGVEWVQEIESAAFSAREAHRVVSYNGLLWLIGGTAVRTSADWFITYPSNDVWSSDNGVDWVKKSGEEGAEFSRRTGNQVVVFDNKIWLIGGLAYKGDGTISKVGKNDIWSSVNGVTWIEEAEIASFSPRLGHGVVEYDGKLVLVGGYVYEVNRKNDTWSSNDGVNWRLGYKGTIIK